MIFFIGLKTDLAADLIGRSVLCDTVPVGICNSYDIRACPSEDDPRPRSLLLDRAPVALAWPGGTRGESPEITVGCQVIFTMFGILRAAYDDKIRRYFSGVLQ